MKKKRKKKRIERKEGKKIKIKKKGRTFLPNERKLLILLFFVEKKTCFHPLLLSLSLSSFHGGARVERIVTSNLENLPPAAAKTRR